MKDPYRSFTVILYDCNPLHLQKVWGSADCIMMKVSRDYCNGNSLSNIEEFKKPCLYILVDENEKAYIGQAKSFSHRVKDHLSKKGWWTQAYVFVSDAGRYHTASVEYLEYRAILAAQEAERYDSSENKQTPSTPTLPPHEHSQMNEAFREIKYFLKYERCLLFEQSENATSKVVPTESILLTQSTPISPTVAEYLSVEQQPILFCTKAKGCVAKGHYFIDGSNRFVVLKGSEISPTTAAHFAHKSREQCLLNSIKTKAGKLILQEDYIFSSPSTASSCCIGRSSNGKEEWKDSEGRSLKHYIEETNN